MGKFINAQVGYAIRNGQTVSTKIIVIVPKGERPRYELPPCLLFGPLTADPQDFNGLEGGLTRE